MVGDTSNCLNCGHDVAGAYCSACGQAASTGRLGVKEILGDALSNLLNLDSKIPRTVVGLTRRPGTVVTEYVEGRRASYVAPFRYCLIVVAVMVVLYASLDIDPINVVATTDSPRIEDQQRIEEVRVEIVRLVNSRLNLVIFLALPLLGLIIRGLFRRSGRNYAECMAFVFFMMGQVFLLALPFGLLQALAPRTSLIARLLIQVGYLSWAAVTFFAEPAWGAGLKSCAASFAYMLAVGLIVALLAGPRVFELLREVGITP